MSAAAPTQDQPTAGPPPTDDATATGSVVEVMLDRPLAQFAQFAGQTLGTWLRGLLDPWRLGVEVAAGSARLAPPFAFLVVALFAAGVGRRLLWAISAVPVTEDASLLEDLRIALGDVSLANATLVTAPCVLLVALTARLLSLAIGERARLDRDVVVRATCYAIGWEAGAVVVAVAGLVALELGGYEPSGALNSEMNTLLPFVALFGFSWGAILLAPTLRDRFPSRWWATPAALASAALTTVPLFLASFATLGLSTDLSSAARRRAERQLDVWVGDLHINVLRTRALDPPDRFELTVAYTSRADRVVVVPASDRFAPPEGSHKRFQRELRVVRSSIDDLPDRALVIQPGATRVAVYEVESLGEGPPDRPSPFAIGFFTHQVDGFFRSGRGVFWDSKTAKPPAIAERPRAATR